MNQLSNAGVLTILQGPLWDTSWLLSEESWPGRVLHVLVGYMDRPTVLQGLVLRSDCPGNHWAGQPQPGKIGGTTLNPAAAGRTDCP